MLQQFQGDLSDDYEYGIVWWGQSNARPWGDRDVEGYVESPHLKLAQAGQDLTINKIEAYPAGASHGAAGSQSKITVADQLVANHYVGAELRLMQFEAQDTKPSTLRAGIATVVSNNTSELIVQWSSAFQPSSTSAVDYILSGFVHLQDRWKSYANVRVLTPYQPEEPGAYPGGAPSVAGYTFPASITGYDTAGLFLPFAWDEGVEGWGASRLVVSIGATSLTSGFDEITTNASVFDATNDVLNVPAHGLTEGDKISFAATDPNYVPTQITLAVAEYFVRNPTLNTFQLSTQASGLTGAILNFSAPASPGAGNAVQIWKLPFRDGVMIGGKVLAGGATATVTANTGSTLTLAGGWSPSTPLAATTYQVQLPHWRNNPYWSGPGAGFRYPSNDMMPGGTSTTGKVYNRAAGQYTYAYKTPLLEAAAANKDTVGGVPTSACINVNGLAQSTGPFTTDWAYIAGSAGLGWNLRVSHTSVTNNPTTGLVQFERYLRKNYFVSLLSFQHNSGELNPNGYWRVAGVGLSLAPSTYSYVDLEAIGFSTYSSPTVTVRSYTPTTWVNNTNSIVLNASRPDVGDVVILIDNGSGTKPGDLSFNTVYYVVSHHGSDEISVSATKGGPVIDLQSSGTFSNVTIYSPPSLHKTTHSAALVTRLVNVLHHRFGAMIEFAWRVSNMIGKRVNVIELGINSSAQIFRNSQNYFGFPGVIGWWDYNKYLDWTPGDPDGNAVRLKKMIATMAPAALTAEGNTKPLRILGIVGFQGEGDAIVEAGREMYSKTLNTFYQWLRNTIQTAGLSPYKTASKIPVVHASLPTSPWELTGTFYGVNLVGDTEGLVNAAISDFAAKDGYAATIDTNDSPKLNLSWFGNDPLHFNGVGEAINGKLAADAFIGAANCALPNVGDDRVIEICNLALSHLGESASITSIDPPDGSMQAAHCARFYPIARDSLLQMQNWSFTMRRETLTSVSNDWTEWDYSYAMPCNVANVVAVLPPEATDDYSTTYAPVNAQYYTAPMVAAGQYVPQPYTIETDENGYKIIYTDQPNAVLRYSALVTDTKQFSPIFVMALSWHLASMLAGPIIKGDQGSAEAKRCAQMMMGFLSKAETSDSNQRNIKPEQITPWMSGR